MATNDNRAYTAGKFAIDVDGVNAGWVSSVEGGQAWSEVITERVGVDHLQHKHVGGVKYEDLSISCGTGMSRSFYEWIKASFDRKVARKNGAVIACDYNFKEVSRLTWMNGLISEIGFPALDASSKDPAKLSVKVSPEFTRTTVRSGGEVGPSKYSLGRGEQKKWLPSNFRIKIDHSDRACSRVNKIDGITLKQKIIENPVGELRDYEKEPASLEIPNLVLTLPDSHADEFYKWHESFVISGRNDQSQERSGTLEYLTSDLKTVLFTLTFTGLGIFRLTPEKVEAGSDNIRRVRAEMYCEDISFKYENSTWA
jgi:phage tail-like protein